jgi:hypothetical protein
LEKVFDMDFLQKYFYGVFELPLPRNAQKRTKKKAKKKKSRRGGWVGLGFSKSTGGSVDFYFGGPSPRVPVANAVGPSGGLPPRPAAARFVCKSKSACRFLPLVRISKEPLLYRSARR